MSETERRDDFGRDQDRKKWKDVGPYKAGLLKLAERDNRIEIMYEWHTRRGLNYRTVLIASGEDRMDVAIVVAKALVDWDKKRRPKL